MNVDLNELYTLAKAATPGPWFNDSEWSSDDVSIWNGEPGDSAVFLGNVGSTPFVEVGVAFDINAANGKFISAANPDVVLHLIERIRQLESKTAVTMGVGDGSGQRFVHGDYESIKAAQSIVLENEQLRLENSRIKNVIKAADNDIKGLRDALSHANSVIKKAQEQEPYAYVHIDAAGDDEFYREIQKTEPHCSPICHLSFSDDVIESFSQETIDFTLEQGGTITSEPLYKLPPIPAAHGEYAHKGFSDLVRDIIEDTRKNNGFTDSEIGRMLHEQFNRALDLVHNKEEKYDKPWLFSPAQKQQSEVKAP